MCAKPRQRNQFEASDANLPWYRCHFLRLSKFRRNSVRFVEFLSKCCGVSLKFRRSFVEVLSKLSGFVEALSKLSGLSKFCRTHGNMKVTIGLPLDHALGGYVPGLAFPVDAVRHVLTLHGNHLSCALPDTVFQVGGGSTGIVVNIYDKDVWPDHLRCHPLNSQF